VTRGRQFRRYRDRFEAEGEAGLVDRRLGRASPKAIGESEAERLRALYRSMYGGWTAKHFHEHGVRQHGFRWGYTWTKTQLHTAGLVARAKKRGAHRRKRERKPCAGMMLHQDGSRHAWLAGQPPLDLIITMDDATSEIYAGFLVEEEGTLSTRWSSPTWPTRLGTPVATPPGAVGAASAVRHVRWQPIVRWIEMGAFLREECRASIKVVARDARRGDGACEYRG
jgi:hypothetical protein